MDPAQKADIACQKKAMCSSLESAGPVFAARCRGFPGHFVSQTLLRFYLVASNGALLSIQNTHLLDGEKAEADATRATRVSCLIMVLCDAGGLIVCVIIKRGSYRRSCRAKGKST